MVTTWCNTLTDKPFETQPRLLEEPVLDQLPVLGEDVLQLVLLQVEPGSALNGEHQLTRDRGVETEVTNTWRQKVSDYCVNITITVSSAHYLANIQVRDRYLI